jgi:peptidoglycan/LPS O-acetylase OafA/YrhL
MAVAVRYKWMFRTAAGVFLLLGLSQFWTFGFTDYHPDQRPYGFALGVLSVVTGAFLFRRVKFAIGFSAVVAGIVCLAATVAAPQAHGPVILFFAGLAMLTGLYVLLSLRVLLDRGARSTDQP